MEYSVKINKFGKITAYEKYIGTCELPYFMLFLRCRTSGSVK